MDGLLNKIYYKLENSLWWLLKYRKDNIPTEFQNNMHYAAWYQSDRDALKKYKNIHKGEDCFIVGNGPSLNKTDLTLLSDYHVFGLNKIHMIFEKQKFDLSYHVTVNKHVIEQTKKELNENSYHCPSFISFAASRGIDYKSPWVHKILTNGRWSFYDSILEPISEGYTVTYVAMQIAYYMGFKNVFLVGVDHNFQQKGKPNEKQKFEGDDLNHFHPDYFKGHNWQLADLEGSEASFALAKHQFHFDGRNIIDATVDGKLTIFEKMKYEDALKVAKKKRN